MKNKKENRKSKWKNENIKYQQKYKSIIDKHKNNIWCPTGKIQFENIKTNSCMDIKKYTNNTIKKCKFKKIQISKANEITKSKKYNMILTKPQKEIIYKWLCACGIMYNKTISFIKK